MQYNCDKILSEMSQMNAKEKTFQVQKIIREIRNKINQSEIKEKDGSACCKSLIYAINKINLEEGHFEITLEICKDSLEFMEDENVRVTQFLCLQKMGLDKHARKSLNEALKIYPNNRILDKYNKEFNQNSIVNRDEILLKNESKTDSFPQNYYQSVNKEVINNALPQISPDQFKVLENMDDAQLQSMFSMAKNMKIKDQFQQMHGRDISDQESTQMEAMMTPQNFKMAMNMMKSNPNLLNNYSQMQRNANTYKTQNKAENQDGLIPQNQMNQQIPIPQNMEMPNLDASSLLQNKETIKMALKMVRENPRMIAEMIASTGKGEMFKNMSDTKLKILANFLYFSILIILETVDFVRKYKGQLLVLLIAVFVFKLII